MKGNYRIIKFLVKKNQIRTLYACFSTQLQGDIDNAKLGCENVMNQQISPKHWKDIVLANANHMRSSSRRENRHSKMLARMPRYRESSSQPQGTQNERLIGNGCRSYCRDTAPVTVTSARWRGLT